MRTTVGTDVSGASDACLCDPSAGTRTPPDQSCGQAMLVHLIGPGGAGKTTTGRLLAGVTGQPFVDLDEEYLKRRSIDEDIDTEGYEYYARTNVDLYIEISRLADNAVIALSSGFMLYAHHIHPGVEAIHACLLASPSTVLLLPSFAFIGTQALSPDSVLGTRACDEYWGIDDTQSEARVR